jgi:histidine triad (HIT) family protein
MTCEACEIIKGNKKAEIVYEDEKTIAFLSDKPLAQGHIIVIPKEHYNSIDDIPEELSNHFFYVASFASTGIYEIMGGGHELGTNIIVNEGNNPDSRFSHFSIDVIPRKSEDGLNLRWEPKPAKKEELTDSENKIKEETFFIGKEKKSNRIILSEDNKKTEKYTQKEEDYLVKQLERIP